MATERGLQPQPAQTRPSGGGRDAEFLPSAVALEEAPCPMGCPRSDTPLATGWDRLHGVGGAFRVVRCDHCALVRTNPRPTMATIGAYYPDNYGPHSGAMAPPKSAERPISLLSRAAMALRLDGTADLVPRMAPGVALEVGCANGRFLNKLRRRGWTAHGVEPSAAAAAIAVRDGFDVQVGPLETVPGFTAKFDLILASHTFEHFHQPLQCLTRLRSWAKPGTWLTCAVPDASTFLFRSFLGAWYDLDLPRHLFHFTPRTLTALLARAGWQVTRVKSQRTLNGLMGSLGYWLRDRNDGRSRAGDAFLRFPETGSRLKWTSIPATALLAALRQTGRMVVWARAV
ncbi:MAG TPA: class I SAM-dependent methyltransferase [Polyangia bacterium]|nr:class I SAM-dependent methyltransferase [Polyangia bacterium]